MLSRQCCNCFIQTIVFCETKRKTDDLTRILRRDGYVCYHLMLFVSVGMYV